MTTFYSQDKLDEYVTEELKKSLADLYKGHDYSLVIGAGHKTTSNGMLNRSVDLVNAINVLASAESGVSAETITRKEITSGQDYSEYKLTGDGKKLKLKTSIPGKLGFTYANGVSYLGFSSYITGFPVELYSTNSDEIFKFEGKSKLLEIFNLDFSSYLSYYDEIEEMFDKLGSLKAEVNKVNKFRTTGGSKFNDTIEQVETISSSNLWYNVDFEEALTFLAYCIGTDVEIDNSETNVDISSARKSAVSAVNSSYSKWVSTVTTEAEALIDKIEGLKPIKREFDDYFDRIKALNVILEDAAYDLNNVASNLEATPFSDTTSYVESIRQVTVDNYCASGEVDTEILNETNIFTDLEKSRMTERLYIDILFDLGIFGDVDPASRIAVTSENMEDYIVSGNFDIDEVVEMLKIYSHEEEIIIDATTFSNNEISSAIYMYMEKYAEKYAGSINEEGEIGDEWREMITAYGLVLDYQKCLDNGTVVIDIKTTDDGYTFVVGEYASPDVTKIPGDYGNYSEEVWTTYDLTYKLEFSAERKFISSMEVDIMKSFFIGYLTGNLEDLKKSKIASVTKLAVNEGVLLILENALGGTPVVGAVVSIYELITMLEEAGKTEAEINDIINQILNQTGRFEIYDNYENYEFSLGVTINDGLPDDNSSMFIIPNAESVEFKNTTSDISIILNSSETSVEYKQAMERLYNTYVANGGEMSFEVFTSATLESTKSYQTEIEELSNMTAAEIVANYDKYSEALKAINTTIYL